MDGILALDLWDLVIEVFHPSPKQTNNTKNFVPGHLLHPKTNERTQKRTDVPIQHDKFDLNNIHHV